MPDQRDLALIRRLQARVALIGERAAVTTAGHWQRLGHDDSDVEAFARAAGPTLTAAKAASIATAVGFYALLVNARPPAVSARDVLIEPNPREPFIAYWRALKMGHSLEEARASGVARAGAVARNLAVSSSRRAGDITLAKTGHKPSKWTRETDSGACEWCELVAQQVYNSAEAADFGHDRCGCTAVPLF